MKLSKLIPFLCLGVVSAAAIGVGAYFIAQNFIDKEKIIDIKPFDWDQFDKDNGYQARDFSKKNSFKVSLTAGEQGNNYVISSGTAWSFYLDNVSSDTDIKWYLFTNFHVVNDAVYYNNGATPSSNLFYKHNVRINEGFALYDSFDNKEEYRPLITSNWRFQEVYPTTISSNAKVDVITDNAKICNNGDDLDLFSNSSYNENNYYNLDMSIIKITLHKSIYNRHLNIFNKIANPFKMWMTNNNLLENVNPKKVTYIAGNPGDEKRLVAAQLKPNTISLGNYDYLKVVSDNPNTLAALNKLYFSSYSSIYPIKNWPLSSGASGSAVYQLPIDVNFPLTPSQNNIFYSLIPVGIYWGGAQISSDKTLFKPSFIPFKSDRYNIFANFKGFLESKYNN